MGDYAMANSKVTLLRYIRIARGWRRVRVDVNRIPQYVITLAGVLEFTTVGGETFTIRPGDVLVAEDHIGSGHKAIDQ